MRYFVGDSADDVWSQAAAELLSCPDYTHDGRRGRTREILPCALRIKDPRQRWVLSRRPPYNPAFGLVEFVWMVTGKNESQVLNYWNPGLPKYSGDGSYYHGAYGYRLRHEFGVDQIRRAYDVLSNVPQSRQVVLQIWKPDIDMPGADGEPVSPDIPCNVISLLKVRDNRLHWTQIMRSNDIMRGLPYNIIQFTMLQEVMAGWLGCELGEYFHFSDSLHVYERDLTSFSVESQQVVGADAQRMSQPYDECQTLFADIYQDLREVANRGCTEARLRAIFERNSTANSARCETIRDMMVVIGSDAARRYGLLELAQSLAASCANDDTRRAAQAWLNHIEDAA